MAQLESLVEITVIDRGRLAHQGAHAFGEIVALRRQAFHLERPGAGNQLAVRNQGRHVLAHREEGQGRPVEQVEPVARRKLAIEAVFRHCAVEQLVAHEEVGLGEGNELAGARLGPEHGVAHQVRDHEAGCRRLAAHQLGDVAQPVAVDVAVYLRIATPGKLCQVIVERLLRPVNPFLVGAAIELLRRIAPVPDLVIAGGMGAQDIRVTIERGGKPFRAGKPGAGDQKESGVVHCISRSVNEKRRRARCTGPDTRPQGSRARRVDPDR